MMISIDNANCGKIEEYYETLMTNQFKIMNICIKF